MTATIDQTAETEVSPVAKAFDAGDFQGMLNALAVPVPPGNVPPKKLPSVVEITREQRGAVRSLIAVLGRVVPKSRRKVNAAEAKRLLRERQVLDVVAAMVERRTKDIRLTVVNHLDVVADETEHEDTYPIAKDGTYVLPGTLDCPGTGKAFRRELATNPSTLDVDVLASLVEDDSVDFTRADFLALTSPGKRVVNAAKAMKHVALRPEVLDAIQRATVPGAVTAKVYVRDAQ